jgi:8-oxo-dGTP diphosphatase
MNKVENKEELQPPTNQATLCFLIKDGKVLLGRKKRRFAEGKWNGFGGKRNSDEDIKTTAIREFQEEAEITPKGLTQVAILNCYHPEWSQQVIVYTSGEWKGNPSETEEMEPRWFSVTEVPYNQMWEDEAIWLPMVLDGDKLKANLHFDKQGKLLDQEINAVESFE